MSIKTKVTGILIEDQNILLVKQKVSDSRPITDLKMVPIGELNQYGFLEHFCYLIKNNFPDSGNYMGMIKNIGL